MDSEVVGLFIASKPDTAPVVDSGSQAVPGRHVQVIRPFYGLG